MSFFFGSNVKKAMPVKVFVPQNKPKSAPLPSVKENNDTPTSSKSADNVTTATDVGKPESAPSKETLISSPAKITATSIRPFAPKVGISKPTISNNHPISVPTQETKKRTRSDSTSSNNNNTVAVAAPSITANQIKENNEDDEEEIVMAEVGQGSSSNNKARKRRKVTTTTSVSTNEDNTHNTEPAVNNDNGNSQKTSDNTSSTNNLLSSRKKQPIASAPIASSNAVSSSANSKSLDSNKSSTISSSTTDKSTTKNNNRSTNNSNSNLTSTASHNPPTNILKPTTAIAKGKGLTFKSKKLERPLFPTFAFGDIPSNRFTRHTVYVRLPAPGLNGIEGVRLSNIQDRAVVTAIQPVTADTPTAMKYLEQIELYDVILAVNHLDARYSTFTQILTTLSRTQSAPVSAQDTYVLDDGTQVSGRDLLLSATYNPHTGNSNSNNSNNNASLDPLGAGLGLGSVGSGIWALLRSQASLNGIPGVMARGSLKNATIDSIARVVFARMPKGHSPAPGPSIAQYLEQQQQQTMLLSMATAANAAAMETMTTTTAAMTNPLMSAEHLL